MRQAPTYGVPGGLPTGTPLKNRFAVNDSVVSTLASFAVDEHMFAKMSRGFMERIAMGPSGCWIWTAAVSGGGYAQLSVRPGGGRDSRTVRASRLAYVLYRGPIPADSELDHVCHSALTPALCAGGVACLHRRCVNPWHLEPCAPVENTRRSAAWNARSRAQLRKTHCREGHPYSGVNLVVHKGKRYCRQCRIERLREWRRRQKATA